MSFTIDKDYLQALAQPTASPGGGSAVGLALCMCASLIQMGAGLTVKKKGFEEVSLRMMEIGARAGELSQRLEGLTHADSTAFEAVMEAYQLPKGDGENSRRTEAIESALRNATQVPIAMMECGLELIRLGNEVAEKGNPNVRPDLNVGILLALAAIKGSAVNAKTNIASMPNQDRDAAFIAHIDSILSDVRVMEETSKCSP